MAAEETSSSYRKIYAAVRRIPSGQVATYGQIARVAGLPNRARQVGYALFALRDGADDVPWQRVINSRGEVSARAVAGPDEMQRRLLEDEGVEFDLRGRIDLKRFQWKVKR